MIFLSVGYYVGALALYKKALWDKKDNFMYGELERMAHKRFPVSATRGFIPSHELPIRLANEPAEHCGQVCL